MPKIPMILSKVYHMGDHAETGRSIVMFDDTVTLADLHAYCDKNVCDLIVSKVKVEPVTDDQPF